MYVRVRACVCVYTRACVGVFNKKKKNHSYLQAVVKVAVVTGRLKNKKEGISTNDPFCITLQRRVDKLSLYK